jgi:hypothetical protein
MPQLRRMHDEIVALQTHLAELDALDASGVPLPAGFDAAIIAADEPLSSIRFNAASGASPPTASSTRHHESEVRSDEAATLLRRHT